jgi:Domain of unknown function (DUF4157)/Bacterial protein of unknown function (DUF922)
MRAINQIKPPPRADNAVIGTNFLQRQCACGGTAEMSGSCAECAEKKLRRKPSGSMDRNNFMEAPPLVREVLNAGGQPLEAAARQFFEHQFGHDFSRVRIHDDARAAESARAVNALAYTVGPDVVFASGRYAPHSIAGRKLLAHELTHVVQQSSAASAVISGFDRGASDPLERAADQLAEKITSKDSGAAVTQSAVLARLPARSLQRYRVPSELPCSGVVDWLDTHSPYTPEWAETHCTYDFNGGLTVTSKNVPSGIELNGKGNARLTVSVNCPVDRPEWSPSRRANRDAEVRAWRNMRQTLDAHENEHRRIGRTWKDTLQSRFRAMDVTVTGSDAADARQQLVDKVQAEQQSWADDAQAAQDAIDPFRGAVLDCP